jgi:hypothetical protein
MENKSLQKIIQKTDLTEIEDECIVLNDEQADDIYGGKWICGGYGNCTFYNCD